MKCCTFTHFQLLQLQNSTVIQTRITRSASVCIPRNSTLLEYAKHVLREGEIPRFPADMDVELEDLEEILVSRRRRISNPINPFLRNRRVDTVGCPEARSEAGAPIASRSLCPWQWVVSNDADVSLYVCMYVCMYVYSRQKMAQVTE